MSRALKVTHRRQTEICVLTSIALFIEHGETDAGTKTLQTSQIRRGWHRAQSCFPALKCSARSKIVAVLQITQRSGARKKQSGNSSSALTYVTVMCPSACFCQTRRKVSGNNGGFVCRATIRCNAALRGCNFERLQLPSHKIFPSMLHKKSSGS